MILSTVLQADDYENIRRYTDSTLSWFRWLLAKVPLFCSNQIGGATSEHTHGSSQMHGNSIHVFVT